MKRRFLAEITLLLLALFLITGCSGGDEDEDGNKVMYPDESCIVRFFGTNRDSNAALVKVPEGTVLIDTGLYENAPLLVDRLNEAGVTKIDLLILTHPDDDHIGGAGTVINTFTVDKILVPECFKQSEETAQIKSAMKTHGLEYTYPENHEKYHFGDLTIKLYAPHEQEYEDSDEYSLAVSAKYAGRRFFFAGDAKSTRMKELVDEKLPKADVYLLPNHGKDVKKCKKLIKRLEPSYCIITSEKPGKDSVARIEEIGAELLSTSNGTITFKVDGASSELTLVSAE